MNNVFNKIRTAAFAAVSSAAVLSGCTARETARVGEGPRTAITRAALAEYPGNAKTSDDVKVAAVDNKGSAVLTLYNLADRAVPASNVWVNEQFVARVGEIPPRESVTVRHTQLIEAGRGTGDLRQSGRPVTKVELQTSEGLFTANGPARE